jgi:hypothetical protein
VSVLFIFSYQEVLHNSFPSRIYYSLVEQWRLFAPNVVFVLFSVVCFVCSPVGWCDKDEVSSLTGGVKRRLRLLLLMVARKEGTVKPMEKKLCHSQRYAAQDGGLSCFGLLSARLCCLDLLLMKTMWPPMANLPQLCNYEQRVTAALWVSCSSVRTLDASILLLRRVKNSTRASK